MAKAKTEETKESLSFLEKKYGKKIFSNIDKLSTSKIKNIISTRSLTLNKALGIGGIPMDGKVTSICGPESTGKTTLLYTIFAEYLSKNPEGRVALEDVENAFDADYALALGMDLDRVDLLNNEELAEVLGIKDRLISGEEYCQFIADLMMDNKHGVIAVDSLPAMIPLADITAGLTGAQLARSAALFSRAYKLWNNALSNFSGAFIWLNQVRADPSGYGNPWKPMCGAAMKFLNSIQIELSKTLDKDVNGVYGIDVKAKITKNKLGSPFKEANYHIRFGEGIIKEYEVLELAMEEGLISKGGSWFTFVDTGTKFQGEDSVVAFLQDNPKYTEELIKKLT